MSYFGGYFGGGDDSSASASSSSGTSTPVPVPVELDENIALLTHVDEAIDRLPEQFRRRHA